VESRAGAAAEVVTLIDLRKMYTVLQAVPQLTKKTGSHVQHDLNDGWLAMVRALAVVVAPGAHFLSDFHGSRWLSMACTVLL